MSSAANYITFHVRDFASVKLVLFFLHFLSCITSNQKSFGVVYVITLYAVLYTNSITKNRWNTNETTKYSKLYTSSIMIFWKLIQPLNSPKYTNSSIFLSFKFFDIWNQMHKALSRTAKCTTWPTKKHTRKHVCGVAGLFELMARPIALLACARCIVSEREAFVNKLNDGERKLLLRL